MNSKIEVWIFRILIIVLIFSLSRTVEKIFIYKYSTKAIIEGSLPIEDYCVIMNDTYRVKEEVR